MLHSNKDGQESKPETLVQKVLSWSVDDILNRNRPSIEVETIPKEFQTCEHYKEAFRSPMLEEIFHQIDSAMVTISKGIDVHYYGRKLGSEMPNEYSVKLCLPKGKNLPSTSDIMLLSERKLESRDQILKDNSFCTILVVTWVSEDVCKFEKCSTVWMDVLLSESPHEGSLDRLFQVMHLANLGTDEHSWQAMTSGFKDTSGIINLILSKSNNGPNGENKASSSEAAIVQFGLNQSQGDVVASCISAIEHSSSSVRLVWGPPGTGKTKTVSVILYFLLKMAKKPRVLVCAPTNTAIGRLTGHLISLLEKYCEAESMQDIILLGNEERLKVKEDKDLSKVYLKYRVKQQKDEESQKLDKEFQKLSYRGRELSDREREEGLLKDAKLVFCTPFNSSRVQHQKFNILVIDEAAYLKECESMIPLAHTKIEHLVLVGDDMQLQSLVKSLIAKEAKYGRSLFERLSEIGYHKDLLNVQYRMHPCISQFPNEKFYDKKIIDGPNVKEYHCTYLPRSIFGTYSFIHVEGGSEEHTGQSFRNLVEADVAANIVCRLAKACAGQKKKTSVGIISQYTAQVTALKERIGNYQKLPFLSVQINTVDSFQGDEKDIIILSTVRHNHDGNVGFLDCHKRANVALTRAKNCLWILGHEETLRKSNSIWHDLVHDAKSRSCWFSARAHITIEEATEAAADEEATEAEADVIEGEDVKIEALEELPQLSQTMERVKVNYKGPSATSTRKSLNKSPGHEYIVRWSRNISASKGGSQMRFVPEGLVEISTKLSESAISVIKSLGFDPCLSISLDSLCDRGLIVWIVSNCEVVKYNNEDAILLNLDPRSPRLITPDVLKIIHGIPRARVEVPQDISDCPDAALKDLQNAVLTAKKTPQTNPKTKRKPTNKNASSPYNSLALPDVKEACSTARSAREPMLEARLFIAALFNFSSFTTSSFYLTQKNLDYVLDIKKVATNDWCKLLVDHLKKGLQAFHESETVWSPVSFLIFFLDNLDCDATTGDDTGNDTMKTPRMQYYTTAMVENILGLLKEGIKLKPWESTVYGRNGIPEVQPDEIEYIVNYKDNVKKRSRLHKTSDAKGDESGEDLKKYESKKHQCPFQEEDDLFVRVPSMKKMFAPSLEGLPSDMVIKANNIVEKFQSSWVTSVEAITRREMALCTRELKQLFGTEAKTYQRRDKKAKVSGGLDIFYENHVLPKINITEEGESGQRIIVDIGTFQLSEFQFVNIFKPDGWMSNWIVQALANIWNIEWDGEKVMLNLSTGNDLVKTGKKDRLLKELKNKIMPHTKLIFIPLLSEQHWFLVVFDLVNNYKAILDTMEGLGHEHEAELVISAVDGYFKSHGFAEIKYKQQSVKQQKNVNDCGFYMLLFTKRIAEGGDIDNIDEGTITEFRKELARFILYHNGNIVTGQGNNVL